MRWATVLAGGCAVMLGGGAETGLFGFRLQAESLASTALSPGTNLVGALLRLTPADLAQRPELREQLDQALAATRGTPPFVDLVRHFQLTNEHPRLLELAAQNSLNALGADALQVLLVQQGSTLVRQVLLGPDLFKAMNTTLALGLIRDPQVVSLLEPVIRDDRRHLALRKQALRVLAQTPVGARTVLSAVSEGRLGDDLMLTAALELNGVPWVEIRAMAQQKLPLPRLANDAPLPGWNELLRCRGDRERGRLVFQRPVSGCLKCHKINGEGADLGPDLSEVGRRLNKEALFEAVLNPSETIVYGYEAHQFELKSGDDLYGLVTDESTEALQVKELNGPTTCVRRNDLASDYALKTSIMPNDLQRSMTLPDLIDLVEYLSGGRLIPTLRSGN